MKLKIIYIALYILALIPSKPIYSETVSGLATTELYGSKYYKYEASKKESLYNVAKKYNWDLEELMKLNPDATATLKRGDVIYYPMDPIKTTSEDNQTNLKTQDFEYEPLNHIVKKGENIYSISKQYGIPLETIYHFNPSTTKGVKPGDIVKIPQNENQIYYYYSIKRGDNLTSISNRYNTTVEEILNNNPGLTVNNLHPGETIRIKVNSNFNTGEKELISEERLKHISGYKVSKNETWEDISDKTGIDVSILMETNNNSGKLPEENRIINVPVVEKVEYEKVVISNPQGDLSEEDIQILYDSIKSNGQNDSIIKKVKLCLILDDPLSNKDLEFTRGALIALSKMENEPYQIDFKVLDGGVASIDLISALEDYEPSIIVTTADKAFPAIIADYANSKNIQVVNVFDIKNDLYEENASMIQILPPPTKFNHSVANKIWEENKHRTLYLIGNPEENDGLASELMILFDTKEVNNTLTDYYTQIETEPTEPILIYNYNTKNQDIIEFFNNIAELSDKYPELDFKIIGRSNWIAQTDRFDKRFSTYKVIIPSRVWLDEGSEAWHQFVSDYSDMFNATPVRSVPNFAASGYDITEYFIKEYEETQGDFNKAIGQVNFTPLQSEFNLNRINNWGGFENKGGYIIKFNPDGSKEKIILK